MIRVLAALLFLASCATGQAEPPVWQQCTVEPTDQDLLAGVVPCPEIHHLDEVPREIHV